MAGERFRLSARVSTDAPDRVRPVLSQLFPGGQVREERGEFVIEAELSGELVRELNRSVLSALRRAEKRTRLRSVWEGGDGTVYRFFDYVLKATVPPRGSRASR